MKKIFYSLIIMAAIIFAGCSKMLEVTDKNDLEAEYHYNNFNDADNAILGIYGKLMGLVEQVIILNELRADLLDITENATADMTAINNHTATPDNKYCDLVPYYEIILNCNDVLANFDKMLAENKMSDKDYSYRYSDVMTVRCWVYLQMAIHFGRIPYVTEPFVTVSDLTDASKRFTELDFDQLLQELVNCMAAIPFKELSSDSPLYGSETNPDGENLKMFFLNKKIMLGDLYLWTATDEAGFTNAAEQYYSVIEEAEIKVFPGSERYGYKIRTYVWDGSNEPGFEICYARYQGINLNAYRNKWKEIFVRASTYSELRYEMITMWNYNISFAPQYPLIEIFANTGKGKYQLRPSTWAINEWESQVQRNSFVFDGRGRQASFDYVNGQPVVIKYLYNYYDIQSQNSTMYLLYNSSVSENAQSGKWFISRAASLILRYCEAANRAGYWDLADALLNVGISSKYSWSRHNENNTAGRSQFELTGQRYSGYRPAVGVLDDQGAPDPLGDFDENRNPIPSVPYPRPFYLDARFTDAPAPFIRGPWCDGTGVRGRAYLEYARPTPEDGLTNKIDSIRWMEKALIKEAALECAFEGQRWNDLLRVAMRKNREIAGSGTDFINEVMENKFKADGKSWTPLTPETWFLPRKQ